MKLDQALISPLAPLLSGKLTTNLPHRLAVGWSGGADSTALLLALKAAGHQPLAWHVDHGWRAASAEDEAMLSARAEAWGIEYVSARLQGKPAANLEASARQQRYEQFHNWSKETGIDTLCLGHQLDDQAETVCMRMLQGSGVAGCRGMSTTRQWQGLHIVRPLLHVPAQQLRMLLHQAGIAWLEDPSNMDTTILRNLIRHRLFTQIRRQGIDPGELFMRWQRQACRIGQEVDRKSLLLLAQRCGEQGVSWPAWRDTTPAVRARALQQLIGQSLGDGCTPGRRHIRLVETWTQQGGRGGVDLSRCRLYRVSDRLHLVAVKAG